MSKPDQKWKTQQGKGRCFFSYQCSLSLFFLPYWVEQFASWVEYNCSEIKMDSPRPVMAPNFCWARLPVLMSCHSCAQLWENTGSYPFPSATGLPHLLFGGTAGEEVKTFPPLCQPVALTCVLGLLRTSRVHWVIACFSAQKVFRFSVEQQITPFVSPHNPEIDSCHLEDCHHLLFIRVLKVFHVFFQSPVCAMNTKLELQIPWWGSGRLET